MLDTDQQQGARRLRERLAGRYNERITQFLLSRNYAIDGTVPADYFWAFPRLTHLALSGIGLFGPLPNSRLRATLCCRRATVEWYAGFFENATVEVLYSLCFGWKLL